MRIKAIPITIILLATLCGMQSCVSQKKFDALQGEYDKLSRNYNDLNIQSKELDASRKELASEKEELDKKIEELKELQKNLKSQYKQETGGLQSQLQKERDELMRRQAELENLQNQFNENNKRLMDLQEILSKKDEAVKKLRAKVADALLGFEGKGLSVTQKNGKVYVSLEEQLLFKSGEWNIEKRGESALKQLSDVLAANPDINVMVEGHTDNVPYAGKGNLNDNWDLSVKRATTVVRALMQNKNVNPKQVTAAGRGEFMPIDSENNAEARRKNRRTEIILTPKLDELLEILEAD